jgi:NodT family efflux transporter outer membrane factor (OMF) lipoprotein
LDLHIALARVLAARVEVKGSQSKLLPHVDFSSNYDHVYYSKDALVNGLIGLAVPVDPNNVQRDVDFFEVGFDAEWEIDLFGLKRHEIRAAYAELGATEEELCDAWITLSAEIAKNYMELRGNQHLLRLLENNIQSQKESTELSKQLLGSGLISEMDYAQAQSQLSNLEGQRALIEFSITRSIHRLSILLAYPPGDLFCELAVPGDLPCLPPCKPIGLPSELLRRRPDIRRAERKLEAATERVGSAVAALFPRFSLVGFAGEISTKAGTLFTPASGTWVAGPQVIIPVFNSTLIVQDIKYNKIQTQIALYEYQKSVLNALEESENAIAQFHAEWQHNQHLETAYSSQKQVLQFTRELHQLGIKNNFDVLTATRSVIEAENAYVASRINLLLHYIALYKALGGCWQIDCIIVDE